MLRKLGEKAGIFLLHKIGREKKIKRKSRLANLYDEYRLNGSEPEDAFRKAITDIKSERQNS